MKQRLARSKKIQKPVDNLQVDKRENCLDVPKKLSEPANPPTKRFPQMASLDSQTYIQTERSTNTGSHTFQA